MTFLCMVEINTSEKNTNVSTLTEQRKSYSRPDPTSKGARDNYENELLLRWRIEARQDRLIIEPS